ncbi:dephospho-CoA kinase [Candidatus Mesenet endosymbiont of Agriotes lineatus]|uniref:dephospho-CoA kinase n=1 Tax=Candidatus Mesenet endosymbiont of Agriotes lineatus TaxID=3077948 RepID=UPI0030CE1A4D
MIILGLTGAIGVGKSFVASCFQRFGAAIFDADATVHKIYQSDELIINLARDYFPDAVVDGAISRSILRKHFFQYSEKWQIFESKIHSLVLEKQNDFLIEEKKKNSKLVVLDVPLLIETKSHYECDFIIFVTVDSKLQNKRLIKRNLTAKEIDLFAKRQLAYHIKHKLLDFTINTSFNKGYTFSQVREIIDCVTRNSEVVYDVSSSF